MEEQKWSPVEWNWDCPICGRRHWTGEPTEPVTCCGVTCVGCE